MDKTEKIGLIVVATLFAVAIITLAYYTHTGVIRFGTYKDFEAGYYVEGVVVFVEKEWDNGWIHNTIVHFEGTVVSDSPEVHEIDPKISFKGDYNFQPGWEYRIYYGDITREISHIEVMQK